MKFLPLIIRMDKFILKYQVKIKMIFLNKLTQFDFRNKKFPNFSMAQTQIARIDCIYTN